MGHHLPGILDEDTQKRVLRGGEFDFGPSELHLPRGEIHAKGSGRKNRLARFRERAPLRGPHPGQQLRGVERLRHIVVRASVESRDLFLRVIANRENQHRDVGPFAQTAQHLDALHVGQAEVEQNHIGPAVDDFGKPGLSRFCFVNLEIRSFEGETKEPANLFLVVDDEGGAG